MNGKCLCGSVTVETNPVNEVGLCHCSMCRKWSSGPLHAVHVKEGVLFNGAENITRFKSSDWAERGFCSKCGTHLFYYLIPADEYVLSAGLFPDENFKLTSEIFVDEKPEYYELNPSSHKMTGQEVFEQYAPKE